SGSGSYGSRTRPDHRSFPTRRSSDLREAVRRHLGERDVATFELWLEEYYRDNEDLKKRMKPMFLALAEIIYEEASSEVGKRKKMPEEARKFMDEYLETFARSEERRVGKECRARWSP